MHMHRTGKPMILWPTCELHCYWVHYIRSVGASISNRPNQWWSQNYNHSFSGYEWIWLFTEWLFSTFTVSLFVLLPLIWSFIHMHMHMYTHMHMHMYTHMHTHVKVYITCQSLACLSAEGGKPHTHTHTHTHTHRLAKARPLHWYGW